MQRVFSSLIVLAVLVSACQTSAKPTSATQASTAKTTTAPAAQPAGASVPTPPQPQTPQADVSSIKAGDTGFSPLAQAPHNYMTFGVHFGRPDLIKGWTIDFAGADGTVVHEIKGTPPQLPPAVTWDGSADTGMPAVEGTYTVKLSVDHGDSGMESVSTDPILLDRTPASGTILVSPQPYLLGDPNQIMEGPQVTLTVNVTPGIAPVSSWRLFVVHPNGSQFMNFISEDHKNNIVVWNGRAQNNAAMEAGTTYNLTAQIFDRYGNVGTLNAVLQVGQGMVAKGTVKPQTQEAPVTVSFDGSVIAQSNIYFPAYSADMTKVDKSKKALNSKALDALATALKSANGTKIKVIGHANKVFWQDQVKGDREQMYVLIPLSTARAHSVQAALVSRGLDASLFEMDGVGAIGAVAPFGDLANNWKNRRVEFNVEN